METTSQWAAAVTGGTIGNVTAKEKLLERAPNWTEVQAEAALRVVEAQIELADHLDDEAKLSAQEIEAREDRRAEDNAREAIREEPW